MIQQRKVTAKPKQRVRLTEQPEDAPDGIIRRPGRPDLEITEGMRNQVIGCVAAGVGICDIANIMDLQERELRKHFTYELGNGEKLATGKTAGRMFRIANEASGREAVEAAKFWLTHKAGWKSTTTQELVGANGEPIAISAEVRTLTDEERVIKTLQLLNLIAVSGTRPDTPHD